MCVHDLISQTPAQRAEGQLTGSESRDVDVHQCFSGVKVSSGESSGLCSELH